jgi:hypothetical protein
MMMLCARTSYMRLGNMQAYLSNVWVYLGNMRALLHAGCS